MELSKTIPFPTRFLLVCIHYLLTTMQEADAVTRNNTDRKTINNHVSILSQTNPRYRILQLQSNSERHRDQINYLKTKYNLDPLSSESPYKSSTNFLVRPEVLSFIAEDLYSFGIPYQDYTTDIHRALKNVPVWRRTRRKRSSTGLHVTLRHKFLPYDELQDLLKYIQNNNWSQSSSVVVGSIGRSFEGRDTSYVKITHQNEGNKKPLIFIDAGIHGREWISPAMAIEIIYRLALNPDRDPDVDRLLTMFDWVIVPIVNPDGYVYTFSNRINNRLWRKSRTTAYSRNPECYGVDLNRNFGFQWNDDPFFGGSSDPCSMTYSGPYSFSEPESRNLRDLLLAHSSSMQAYLSFHSFGQFFLYPWGFSSMVDLEDENDLHHVASAFADTMKARNYKYHVGGTAKILYPAAGGSDDYVRGSLGVKYAFTIELPPHETSHYGFLLPEDDVKSVVTDTWEGLKSVVFRLHRKLTNETDENIARG